MKDWWGTRHGEVARPWGKLVLTTPQKHRTDQHHYDDGNTGYGKAGIETKVVDEGAHYGSKNSPGLCHGEVVDAIYLGTVTLRCLTNDVRFWNRQPYKGGYPNYK